MPVQSPSPASPLRPTPAPAGAEQLVSARGVSVSYGHNLVLDRVDLDIARGEIVTLIGLNGAGKTTFARAILGLVKPVAGTIQLRPGLRIGYTPQHLSVDATLPLTVARFLTLGGNAPRSRLEAVLDEVGARHVISRQLAALSGGELHRVLLARALLRKPDLLVLDEPMSGVDVAGQSELYHLVGSLRDRYRCGILLVSHDLHLVMAATDIVVCLNGHVCCTGHPRAVVEHPAFLALFGRRVGEELAIYRHHHDHRHDADGMLRPAPPDAGNGIARGDGG